MVNLAQLDRPFVLGKMPATSEARVAQMLRLSNQGDYEEAARIARSLVSDQGTDLQVVTRHHFGAFLEHGFAALPAVLDSLAGTLENAFAAPDADPKKLRKDADLNVTWLCRTLRDRLDFHHAQRDPVYKAWLAAVDPPLIEAIRAASTKLYGAVERLVPGSRTLELLAGIGAYANETLRGLGGKPAAPPRAPAPAAPPREPAPEANDEEESPARAREVEPVPLGAASQPAADAPGASLPPTIPGGPADDCDSPAMRLFRGKIAAFAALMERGDFARAAVVAGDINHIVDQFDPRLYLPRLLSPYFRRLASGVEDLAPHWETTGSPAWKAMEQLYLVDLEAFLDEG